MRQTSACCGRVEPVRDERGWRFLPDAPDPVNGFRLLREAYLAPHGRG